MKTIDGKVETIIDGSISPAVISQAITTYIEGLQTIAFPAEIEKTLGISGNLDVLHTSFDRRAKQIGEITKQIILQINRRARELSHPDYLDLQAKDTALWYTTGPKPQFGVLVCVDKGISGETMGINVSNVGRVLAGDIEFSYIPSKKIFFPNASALIKRFIHWGRQGKNILVEPIIEHTNCGRRAQILANEEARGEIPSLGFIFANIHALVPDYPSRADAIQKIWHNWPRRGVSVITPDNGLYAGIIQKMAQKQALAQLKQDITIISPIEVYEKETGNLYAGLDQTDVLTDSRVLRAQGFTRDILTKLSSDKTIFSLSYHTKNINKDIEKLGVIRRGSRSYHDLQYQWIACLADLVSITETLWQLYAKKNIGVTAMVTEYFHAWNRTRPANNNLVDRRIIHHLFHVAAYAFLFDTIQKGHTPGLHHIEHYLATGDHEIGTKPLIGLGQGDLDRPSASEMFTGYSVLLHSNPGRKGTPIPVVIKLDTDRTGDKPMSTEETNVAFDDLFEFLKLWPYFLVGDMIPILMVRGKHMGGVSRLGLSIIRSLGDMTILFEQSEKILPRFVPANNTKGAVVLIPAKQVIEAGIRAKGNLKSFRKKLPFLADEYSDPAVQRAYMVAHGILQTSPNLS